MPASTRIRGKSLIFKLDNDEYSIDATSVILSNEEASTDEVITFCETADGAVQWYFEVEAITSTDATSFWSFCWDNAGTDVAFVFAPHGNATVTANQPHFTGTLNVGPKPSIGGAVNSTFVFTKRFDLVGEPVRDVTP
jgi:hypothetical protein